jgi:hypothetical protein
MRDYVKAIIILFKDREGFHDAIAAFIRNDGCVIWKDLRTVGHSANLCWHPGLGPRDMFANGSVVIRIYDQLPEVIIAEGTTFSHFPIPALVIEDAKIQHEKLEARLKGEDENE